MVPAAHPDSWDEEFAEKTDKWPLHVLSKEYSGSVIEPNLGWLAYTLKSIYWHQVLVKESAVFTAGHQARSPGQQVLITPEFPDEFQQSIF